MRRLKNPAGAKALLLMTTSTPPISNTAFLTVKGEVVQLDSTGRQIGSLAYDRRLSLERFRVSAQTDNRCIHTLYAWQVTFNSPDLGLEKARAAVKTLARVEAFLLKAHQKEGAPRTSANTPGEQHRPSIFCGPARYRTARSKSSTLTLYAFISMQL